MTPRKLKRNAMIFICLLYDPLVFLRPVLYRANRHRAAPTNDAAKLIHAKESIVGRCISQSTPSFTWKSAKLLQSFLQMHLFVAGSHTPFPEQTEYAGMPYPRSQSPRTMIGRMTIGLTYLVYGCINDCMCCTGTLRSVGGSCW